MSVQEATRIIAIRHGETEWNLDFRIQGHLDIALNERGRWQAERVADALRDEPISAIYSSDLQRAFDTARALGRAVGLTPIPDPGLRERGFGRFEGRTFAEVEQASPETALRWRKRDPDFAPEGGENLLTFRLRLLAVCERLARAHPGEQIVLVAHGGVMDILYRAATGQDLQAARSWELRNAAINRLLWNGRGYTLVGWGDVSHLNETSRDEALS